MELIDKEELKNELTKYFKTVVVCDDAKDVIDVICAVRACDLEAAIDKAPTFKSLEPVVRCRDCVYWSDISLKVEIDHIKSQYCEAIGRMTKSSFYCAYGERKCNLCDGQKTG